MLVESRFMNVEQLQKFLSLKKSRIYYLTHKREIPCIFGSATRCFLIGRKSTGGLKGKESRRRTKANPSGPIPAQHVVPGCTWC